MAPRPSTSSELNGAEPSRAVTDRRKSRRRSSGTSQGLLAWPRRWRYARQDAQVDEWKDAWRAGAQARWSGAPSQGNPYDNGSRRSAWAAGWQWAGQQPDRRARGAVRFAHPLRRSSDSSAVMMRRGAVGLSIVTMLGWLWRSRGRPTELKG